MSEWAEKSIESLRSPEPNSIAMGPFGSRIKKENFVSSGIPIIKGGNLTGTFLVEDEFDYLTEEKATELGSANAYRGDLVITHRGTIGQVGIIPDNSRYERYVVSQSQLKVSLDRNRVNPLFVYYFFQTRIGQQRLLENAAQVGVPAIARASSSVKAILVPLPESRCEQDKIVNILKTLDDKIALNRKLNETLEGMARALFQSWFVDFDPVKARLAAVQHGRDPERACMAAISGKLRIHPGKPKPETLDEQLPSAEELDEAIAALDDLPATAAEALAKVASHFPSDFQESELGLIPEGWEVSEIGKEVSIFGGATPSTKEEKYWNGENPWATPKDLSGLPSKVLISTDRKITDAGVGKISSGQLPKGTVLMSSRAPVGYLALATTPTSINQGFIAMVCDKTLPNTYALLWAEVVMDEIKSNASGSTFAEISKKTFRPMKILVPKDSILDSYDQMVSAFYNKITSNEYQSRTLAELRDTLLPKLLSGELPLSTT